MAGSMGHDNQGEQSPEVSGRWPVCGTDTTRHVAPSAVGEARGAQWMERERREARRGPEPLPGSWGRARPNADPRKRGGQEGERQARGGGCGVRRSGAGTQKSMQEGAEGGGAGKLPPGAAGPGRALGRPRPSGPCCAGLAPGVGPSSLLLHAASLAQRVQLGLVPRQPPAAGSSVPSLPWGWGLVTKVPVGLWSGEHGGRFSSESSPRARPASGPAQGRMSRGAVCHHLVF